MTPRPLLIASAGAFVAALSTSLVAVSAPVIARDFGATPSDVSWVLSAYLLAVSSLLALAGKAGDVVGRRWVYIAGFAVFVVGSLLSAAAFTLPLLVAARIVQGIGGALLMAVGPAIITRAVPPKARGRALGIQQATLSIGLTLGPAGGGVVAAKIGWHAVFVVIAAAAAVVLALATALLPRDAEGQTNGPRPSLDLPGAVLFGGGLIAWLVALKRTQDEGWTGRIVLLLGAIGLVLLVLFIRRCARVPSPLLPLPMFRRPVFATAVLGSTLLYTVTFMLTYVVPFQLQRGLGLSPAAAGLFMTAQPATMAFVAPASGFVSDRWGARLPGVMGMFAIALGMTSVAFTANAASLPLVASLALVGVGAGLFVAPNSALLMGAAPREHQSAAAAMASTARTLGMTLGVALAATLEHAVGFRAALLVAAGLSLGGVLLGAARPVAAS